MFQGMLVQYSLVTLLPMPYNQYCVQTCNNMSQTIWSDKKILFLSFIAAGTTVAAGVLHIAMAPRSFSHDMGQAILFLVGGVLQVFWAVPVIKRWGRVWQIIGIAGTAVFVILWFTDRLHILPEGHVFGGAIPGSEPPREFPRGNMSGGEFPRGNIPDRTPEGIGFMLGGNSLPIETCQIAFIGLYAVLSRMYSRIHR